MSVTNRHIAGDGDTASQVTAEPNGVSSFKLVSGTHGLGHRLEHAEELRLLDEEIARAEMAYRVMIVADELMRLGADEGLLPLGFTAAHIADLRKRAGRGGGYPPYSLRNIQETLSMLRNARQQCATLDVRGCRGS